MNQEDLLRVAEELFAERGYAATTVRDIAEAAGILSGSLYHHIDSKESIIDAILSRDYPLSQALISVLLTGVIVVNLCTDILYGFVDPRVRHD